MTARGASTRGTFMTSTDISGRSAGPRADAVIRLPHHGVLVVASREGRKHRRQDQSDQLIDEQVWTVMRCDRPRPADP